MSDEEKKIDDASPLLASILKEVFSNPEPRWIHDIKREPCGKCGKLTIFEHCLDCQFGDNVGSDKVD